MNTLEKYEELMRKQAEITKEILALQHSCSHINTTKVAKSDTGNYCKADDAYWYECKCRICGKYWTEDQ